jgi:hypothetical protein
LKWIPDGKYSEKDLKKFASNLEKITPAFPPEYPSVPHPGTNRTRPCLTLVFLGEPALPVSQELFT